MYAAHALSRFSLQTADDPFSRFHHAMHAARFHAARTIDQRIQREYISVINGQPARDRLDIDVQDVESGAATASQLASLNLSDTWLSAKSAVYLAEMLGDFSDFTPAALMKKGMRQTPQPGHDFGMRACCPLVPDL